MSDTLTITTPSEREVTVTRSFSASRSLVFDALTKPELLRRWYGPTGWELLRCEIDLRSGGKWHFVSRHPNGKEIGQLGVSNDLVSQRLCALCVLSMPNKSLTQRAQRR